jgi:formate dehydrogenase
MNVYVEHKSIRTYLKEQEITDIHIVDEKSEAEYYITGRYTMEDYHPGLRGIIIPWTGHNGIHLDDMRKHNTELYITPTRSRYVAEKAVTLTLALLGRTIEYHTNLQQGNWSSRNSEKRVPWRSILDLNIGLFGYGRIGTLIHQFLSGFGCHFYTLDRSKWYPDTIWTVSNLNELVSKCDVIIISAPLNHTTEGLFDKEILRQMKGKFLINVGRGKIVDETALYESLTNNELAGYASDVWYTYPKGKELQYPSTLPIYQLDNVVLSNHSGGFTVHTNEEVNRDLVKRLIQLRDGDTSDQLDITNLL